MVRHYFHDNEGRVCSTSVSFDYEDGKIKNVVFDKGCMGNTQGVARLAEGRDAEELVKLLKGVECRGISSCPNELACAIEEMLQEIQEEQN